MAVSDTGITSPRPSCGRIFGSCVLVSKAIVLAQLCLLPLLLASFALWPIVSRTADATGLHLPSADDFEFLRRQSEAMASRGVDKGAVAAEFQVFASFVWLSVSVAALRLLSGPFLFPTINRALHRNRPSAPVAKLVLGWICAGPLAAFAAGYGLASASQFDALLRAWPRVYLGFEAFMFVGGILFTVEGALGAARGMQTWWRGETADRRARPPTATVDAPVERSE
jgi:hypothetical protein